MSAPNANKLVSKLRYELGKRRKLRTGYGQQGRHDKIRKLVTGLIKHERIETTFHVGDEARGYAERLISDAIRYGDTHRETMDMANYWLLEKQLIHKLFKVLVPRYADCPVSYTNMLKAPKKYPGRGYDLSVLELRNNIYPSLIPSSKNNRNLIHNVLLDEAKKDFRKEKYSQIPDNLVPTDLDNDPLVEGLNNLDVTDGGSKAEKNETERHPT